MKKVYIICAMLICVSMVIIYQNNDHISTSKITQVIPINNIGNTLNGGSFFMDSDTLYGRIIPSHPEYNIHGYFNLSSQKFGQADANVLDFNNDVSNVVVYDKTIYFTNTAPQGTPIKTNNSECSLGYICSINLDTGNYVRITDKPVYCFYIYNDKLFYQTRTYPDKDYLSIQTNIYCCTLEGKNENLVYAYLELNSPVTGLFSVYGGKIYIPIATGILQYIIDTKEVYSFTNILSDDQWQVNKVLPIQNTLLVGLEIPFTSYRCLCSLDMETDKVDIVSSSICDNFTSDNRYIYFFENSELYKYDFYSKTRNLIAQNPDFLFAFYPEIIGDEIYFFQTQARGGYGYFRKIFLQTGELTAVTDSVQITRQMG